MSVDDIINGTLRKVAKGAGLYLFGMVIGLSLRLITRIIVIRYLSLFDYGILSFTWVIISVFSTLGALGIPGAVARQASFFIGKGELKKANAVIKVSAFILFISSGALTAILIISSDYFAIFFKMPELGWVLRISVLTIPFLIMFRYFVSVFQVLERVDVRVIFENLLQNLLKLILVLFVILYGLKFYGIIWAYVLAPIFATVMFFIYFIKNIKLDTKEKLLKYVKIVFIFAIPILVQTVLGLILVWMDVFMVGYYLTPVEVALYNGARPLATMLETILAAVNFLYLPLVSQLYAQNKIREIGRIYAMITKWIVAVTTPAFLVMFLFPSAILWILYGSKYIGAHTVLKILILTFFIHVALGPNGNTLLAFGELRFTTITSVVAAISNFILNFILIPIMGINGAAIATLCSYVLFNALLNFRLYFKHRIHPFTKNYVKPLMTSFVAAEAIYFVVKGVTLKWYGLVILFVVFVTVYILSLLLTKSFDREDISLILAMEDKLGVNLDPIKKVLRKFVK